MATSTMVNGKMENLKARGSRLGQMVASMMENGSKESLLEKESKPMLMALKRWAGGTLEDSRSLEMSRITRDETRQSNQSQWT